MVRNSKSITRKEIVERMIQKHKEKMRFHKDRIAKYEKELLEILNG